MTIQFKDLGIDQCNAMLQDIADLEAHNLPLPPKYKTFKRWMAEEGARLAKMKDRPKHGLPKPTPTPKNQRFFSVTDNNQLRNQLAALPDLTSKDAVVMQQPKKRKFEKRKPRIFNTMQELADYCDSKYPA